MRGHLLRKHGRLPSIAKLPVISGNTNPCRRASVFRSKLLA
jgi:hypothetical protein